MTNAKSNSPSLPSPSQEAVNVFVIAARDGDNAAVIEFLDKYGADFIDEKNNYGHTALILAAWCGYKGTVTLLLEKGAAVDEKNSDGQTALALTALGGYQDIAALLLGKGAAIDEKDNEGKTALMWAVLGGCFNTVALLLESGAAINATDNDGDSALLLAKRHGHTEIAALLRQERAAAAVESRIEKLKRLRPAKPVLKKPGSP